MQWQEKKMWGSDEKRETASIGQNYSIEVSYQPGKESSAKLICGTTLTEAKFLARDIENAKEIGLDRIGEWIQSNIDRWTKVQELFERGRLEGR